MTRTRRPLQMTSSVEPLWKTIVNWSGGNRAPARAASAVLSRNASETPALMNLMLSTFLTLQTASHERTRPGSHRASRTQTGATNAARRRRRGIRGAFCLVLASRYRHDAPSP
jgi:hypothetical protein